MTMDDEEIEQEKLDKDRELIATFLEYTRKTQEALKDMSDNNVDMRKLVEELKLDKGSQEK